MYINKIHDKTDTVQKEWSESNVNEYLKSK